MPTFTIRKQEIDHCMWNTQNNMVTFHPNAIHNDTMLVVGEDEKLEFILYNPTTQEMVYRIFIGDTPLSDIMPDKEDAGGYRQGGHIYWRALYYFESARGCTNILLEAQPEDSTSDMWKPVFSAEVYVLTNKIEEKRYLRMENDLKKLSHGLLADLYGKSKQTHELCLVKAGILYQSREQELKSIEKVINRLSPLLCEISRRPASRFKMVAKNQRYRGGERLTSAGAMSLYRQTPLHGKSERPLLIQDQRREETFDIPEHSLVNFFLRDLIQRAKKCENTARQHIKTIIAEQPFRNIRLGLGPSIYESVDMPRIKRLHTAVNIARKSIFLAQSLGSLSFLKDAPPKSMTVQGGAFQRSPEYQLLLNIMHQFWNSNAIWIEGEESLFVKKLTSRLFEQWCYLMVVEAFRSCGVKLKEWGSVFRQYLRSHFCLDFNRGLIFEGELCDNLRLRFRYEPWISGKELACKANETLCREPYENENGNVSWCPDIIIECQRKESDFWKTIYGIVLDSKYVKVQNKHLKKGLWDGVIKYLDIRSTDTNRQVIKQLWLIAPSNKSNIISQDGSIVFNESHGPSCASTDTVRFSLMVAPTPFEDEEKDTSNYFNIFRQFANGTMNYLKREFGSAPR